MKRGKNNDRRKTLHTRTGELVGKSKGPLRPVVDAL